MTTEEGLEEAHLAMIRKHYPRARQILEALLEDEPENPDAKRMLADISRQEQDVASFTQLGASGSPTVPLGPPVRLTLYQALGTGQWHFSAYIVMAVVLYLGCSGWIDAYRIAAAHHFALRTTVFRWNRYSYHYGHAGDPRYGHMVSIWPSLIIYAVMIIVSLASLIARGFYLVTRRL